jgi:hypothetical protein
MEARLGKALVKGPVDGAGRLKVDVERFFETTRLPSKWRIIAQSLGP